MKEPFIYILTNKPLGTLYIGVTSNLIQRIAQHKQGTLKGFSYKYNLKQLVYYEQLDCMIDAIHREKQLKNWHRQWKVNLITEFNPQWQDLSDSL
jgi:putative endonuclease